jgi:hypothetical protein
MTTIQIKIFLDSEIRRISKPTKTTFDEFVQTIYSFYLNQKPEATEEQLASLTFTYQDIEGDWVNFSTNEEWREALQNFNQTLKIKVNSKKSTPENKHCPFKNSKHFQFPSFQHFPSFNVEEMFGNPKEFNLENLFGGLLGKNEKENAFDFSELLNSENIQKAKKFLSPFLGEECEKYFDEIVGNIQKDLNVEKKSGEEEISLEQVVIENEEKKVEYPKLEEPMESIVEEKVEYPKVDQPGEVVEKCEENYENLVELLNQMGFNQESVNRYLLNKHKGDIQKVIFDLLTPN